MDVFYIYHTSCLPPFILITTTSTNFLTFYNHRRCEWYGHNSQGCSYEQAFRSSQVTPSSLYVPPPQPLYTPSPPFNLPPIPPPFSSHCIIPPPPLPLLHLPSLSHHTHYLTHILSHTPTPNPPIPLHTHRYPLIPNHPSHKHTPETMVTIIFDPSPLPTLPTLRALPASRQELEAVGPGLVHWRMCRVHFPV